MSNPITICDCCNKPFSYNENVCVLSDLTLCIKCFCSTNNYYYNVNIEFYIIK